MHQSLAVVVLALAACGEAEPAALQEDAYVWQRAWTPAVDAAVRERGRTFDAVRVLAVDVDDRGAVTVPLTPDALAGRRVIPVIRVDGSGAIDGPALAERARATVERLRGERVNVVALEIDHDCATSKLAAYATALAMTRHAVAPLPLQITALPSWAPSRALDDVLRAADAVTLQVHAVDHPSDGLFSTTRARTAIDAFARSLARSRSSAVLWVALPAYGTAVADDGAVESEAPRADLVGARMRELWAEPGDVAALLRSLARDRPKKLVGVAWFRLPVDGDRRAWSFATLQAVRAGDVRRKVTAAVEHGDVVVRNTGNVDATAPARIDVGGDVTGDASRAPAARSSALVGDGVRGYVFDADAGIFTATSPPRVRAGDSVVVGWVRASDDGDVHDEVRVHAK